MNKTGKEKNGVQLRFEVRETEARAKWQEKKMMQGGRRSWVEWRKGGDIMKIREKEDRQKEKLRGL